MAFGVADEHIIEVVSTKQYTIFNTDMKTLE